MSIDEDASDLSGESVIDGKIVEMKNPGRGICEGRICKGCWTHEIFVWS